MAKPSANHLRIFREETSRTDRNESVLVGSLPEVQRAFQELTGWSLRYESGPVPNKPTGLTWSTPVTPGRGMPPGHLRLTKVGSEGSLEEGAPPDEVRRLGSALGGMIAELLGTHHALWLREAELAAGVPVVAGPYETEHLAVRLQAVLKSGAESVGCPAAGLYLLDEATTSLKLRSSFGMPRERLAEPARPLQGALADLEAMLGHAVVLTDLDRQTHWNPPEDFAAAVCVPVCTPTTILGTLWMFSNEPRDFTDRETSLVEVIAGRLAADLERENLLREGTESSDWKRELSAVQRLQRNQLPTIAPLLEGWDVAGWTDQAGTVGGDFFDWFALSGGMLAAAVGDVAARGVEAAFAANTVKAATRAHGQYHRNPEALLKAVNLTLWTGASGDQFAHMFFGLVETATGMVRYACAGNPSVLRLSAGGWESFTEIAPQLGESPETAYPERICLLTPGNTMVILSEGARKAKNAQGLAVDESQIAEVLARHQDAPAATIVQIATEFLGQHRAVDARHDRTILVIKRTAG
ncbi:MAG: SpoIIE family protein phosphatase [Planctomycetaceae bacterium]|nr:SpoIIE family protein phosphatase [Planctomycetaceae bacterium]